jgi:hypothetical protein
LNSVKVSSVYNSIVPQPKKKVKCEFDGHLTIYPDLTNASFKLKKSREYTMWLELKALNKTGSGVLPLKETIQDLKEHFNYSQSKTYRLLDSGNGIFFELTGHKAIRLFSYKNLAIKFELPKLGRSRILDVKGIKLNEIRAYVYSAIYKTADYQKDHSPMSRQTIKDLTGLKSQTQRRYEKKAKVKVKQNFSNELVTYESKNTTHVCFKQLGNSARSMLRIGGHIQVKQINKVLGRIFVQSVKDRAISQDSVSFNDKPKLSKSLFIKDYFSKAKNPGFNMWEVCPKFVS